MLAPRLEKKEDLIAWARTLSNHLDRGGGQLLFSYHKVKLITGTNNDVPLPDATFIQVAPDGLSGNFVITGLAGGMTGRLIVLLNMTPFVMTLRHLDIGSQPSNQIDNTAPGSSNISSKCVTLIHGAGSDPWFTVSYI